MLAICAGISGTNKMVKLGYLKDYAFREHNINIKLFDLGEMIEKEATKLFNPSRIDMSKRRIDKKILDLSQGTRTQLTATVWEKIKSNIEENNIISIHSCFRWNHYIMPILLVDQIKELKPDTLFTMVRDPNDIKKVIERDPKWKDKLSIEEIYIWQNEEITAMNLLSSLLFIPHEIFSIEIPNETLLNYLLTHKKIKHSFKPFENGYKTIYISTIPGTLSNKYIKSFCKWAKIKMSNEIDFLNLNDKIIEKAKEENKDINEYNLWENNIEKIYKWRQKAFEEILFERRGLGDCIVLSQTVNRLDKGKFNLTFDPCLEAGSLYQLNPDVYISLIDNVSSQKIRFITKSLWKSETLNLRDILIWRDEDIFYLDLISNYFNKPFFLLPVAEPFETLYRIAFENKSIKIYLSYPITEILGSNNAEKYFLEKSQLRDELRKNKNYVLFDPLDIKEGIIRNIVDPKTVFPFTLEEHFLDLIPNNLGVDIFKFNPLIVIKDSENMFKIQDTEVLISRDEIEEAKAYISDQIVARDYRLINQSDWVIVYYPVTDVSSGVLSEVIYGYCHGKDVFTWWRPRISPFLESYITDKQPSKTKENLFEILRKYEKEILN